MQKIQARSASDKIAFLARIIDDDQEQRFIEQFRFEQFFIEYYLHHQSLKKHHLRCTARKTSDDLGMSV